MGLELVTGYAGKPHITAHQDAIINALITGTGKYVIGIGNMFKYAINSNTSIRINDGYAINQGRLIGMGYHDYEDIPINVGISGNKRSDIIGIKYSKDFSTGVEKAEFSVVTGTAGEDYVDPSYSVGDILVTDAVDDFMPLYRVKIDGLNIQAIQPLFLKWYPEQSREDLIIIENFNKASGPPEEFLEPFSIRLSGTSVKLEGVQYGMIGKDAAHPTRLTLPHELAPKTTYSWKESLEYKGTEYIVYYEINHSGILTIYGNIPNPIFLRLGDIPVWHID